MGYLLTHLVAWGTVSCPELEGRKAEAGQLSYEMSDAEKQ
jgi:hypothetical protein